MFKYNPDSRLAKPAFNFARMTKFHEKLSNSWILRGYPKDANPIPSLVKNYQKHSNLQFQLSQIARKLNEASRKYGQVVKKQKSKVNQNSHNHQVTCENYDEILYQNCLELKEKVGTLSKEAQKLESEMTDLAYRAVNFTSPRVEKADKIIKVYIREGEGKEVEGEEVEGKEVEEVEGEEVEGEFDDISIANSNANSIANSNAIANSNPLKFYSNPNPCSNGEPKNNFDKNLKKNHVLLGGAKYLGLLDLEKAGSVIGNGFYFAKDELVLLERALTSYAIDVGLKRGWNLLSVPDLVKKSSIVAAGFLPKSTDINSSSHGNGTGTGTGNGNDIIYEVNDGENSSNLCLAGTSELSILSYLSNRHFDSSELPLKFMAESHCFRRETCPKSNLYRLRQFTKVEMFSVVESNSDVNSDVDGKVENEGDEILLEIHKNSDSMLQEILSIQEEIVKGLGLSYRILRMGHEELGASAYEKYDIEVWMPGLGKWGEVTSASNCSDYQSRRISLRKRPNNNLNSNFDSKYLHTLNGTALAVPRIVLAILESFNREYEENGIRKIVIDIPPILKPYLLGNLSETLKIERTF